MMNDVIVRYKEMPLSVEAFTVTDENDDYNVYINSALGFSTQEKAKQHELSHIRQNHFYSNKPTAVCEKEV